MNVSGLEAKRYPITLEGIKELQEELAALKQRRKSLTEEIREMISQSTDMGIQEDSAFALNQNQVAELDGQINLLEHIIGLASIIKKPTRNDHVQLGSTVMLKINDSKKQQYTLVGPVEANPSRGKISVSSPLGQALLGKKVNDQVEVISPTNQRTVAVVLQIE